MMKSALIKFSSALVLLLYALACTGIGVHVCSCTGNVCVAPAFHHHDEHGSVHKHHHHSHDCLTCDDAGRHEEHGCCHDEVFRIAFAGEESRDLCTVTSPEPFVAAVISVPYSFAPAEPDGVRAFAVHAPPRLCGDILRHFCIMRV